MRRVPLTALALLGGCLTVPAPPPGTCKQTSDCASGEQCQEGVCWGDPPPGPFTAALGPPSDRPDLVPVELAQLSIPQDGQFGSLAFTAPVTIAGRVEVACPTGSCSTASVGATLTIQRTSLFAGGPGFTTTVTAKNGVARGANSFTANVPMTNPGEPGYTITVVPDRGTSDPSPPTAGPTPAMLAPPARLTDLMASGDVGLPITLGSGGLLVSGTLQDAGLPASPLSGYRVVARGQWDATSALTEVSTVAYVQDGDQGAFSLTVANDVYGTVEIVATPYDPTVVAPTLMLAGVTPGDGLTHVLAQPVGLGSPVPLRIHIEGDSGNGQIAGVVGANVIIGASDNGIGAGAHPTAALSVEAMTDGSGDATVSVLDGPALATGYTLRVVPPAGSSLGAVFDAALPLGSGATTCSAGQMCFVQQLPSRLALSGTVVDVSGAPIANVAVTAVPSLRFQWTLGADKLQFVGEIPPATTVTPSTGDFVLWVDPLIGQGTAGVWAGYDLQFQPPQGSTVPVWQQQDIQVPRVDGQMTLGLGSIAIPGAVNVHGTLVDELGGPVSGGDLRIFQINTDLSLCAAVPYPPTNCVIPASLVGQGTSDDQGIVRLTLPSP